VMTISTAIRNLPEPPVAHRRRKIVLAVLCMALGALLTMSGVTGEAATPLIFDVADDAAVKAGAAQVAQALGNRKLFGLVNNAGIAVPGPLLYLDAEELKRQFEINLFGVHRVTQAFAPLLGADQDRTGAAGRIVMISSVGGQNGSPFVGPYAASKFALEGYSQSLRRELMLFGIDVIVIGPGAIATPIWDKAEGEDLKRFSNTPYAPMMARVADYMVTQGKKGLPPADVGALIWKCLTDPKPRRATPSCATNSWTARCRA